MQLHLLAPPCLRFAYLDEVDYLGHLAFGLVIFRLYRSVAYFEKTKGLGGCNLVLFAADKTFYQLYFQLCHIATPF